MRTPSLLLSGLLLAGLTILTPTASAQPVRFLPNTTGHIAPGFRPNPPLGAISSYNAAAFSAANAAAAAFYNTHPLFYPGTIGFVPPLAMTPPVVVPTPLGPTITSVPYAPAFNSLSSYPSPGAGTGYPGYFPPYYPGLYYNPPYGAAMTGLANLTEAQGQYLNDWQRARLLNQQVEQAKIETRRQLREAYRRESTMIPTLEEIRQKERDQSLARARKQPPVTEILSGRSLNDLLAHASAMQAQGVKGPSINLDDEVLRKINVGARGRGGNIGMLKNEGKLDWPLVLRGSAYEKPRTRFEMHAPEAIKQAEFNNRVDGSRIKEMLEDLQVMRATLDASVATTPPQQFMAASRYLNFLDDAMTALQDPNVSNFFTRKWAAQGKTVGELVEYFRKNGLHFVAATPGDEAAYHAMYNALLAYDMGTTQLATKP